MPGPWTTKARYETPRCRPLRRLRALARTVLIRPASIRRKIPAVPATCRVSKLLLFFLEGRIDPLSSLRSLLLALTRGSAFLEGGGGQSRRRTSFALPELVPQKDYREPALGGCSGSTEHAVSESDHRVFGFVRPSCSFFGSSVPMERSRTTAMVAVLEMSVKG